MVTGGLIGGILGGATGMAEDASATNLGNTGPIADAVGAAASAITSGVAGTVADIINSTLEALDHATSSYSSSGSRSNDTPGTNTDPSVYQPPGDDYSPPNSPFEFRCKHSKP